MTRTATIEVKTTEDIKAAIKELAAQEGITMSTFLHRAMLQAVRQSQAV